MSAGVTAGAGQVALRPVTPEDGAFLLALYATTRDDLALLADEQRVPIVEMQFRAQDLQYRHANPDASFDIIEVDGRPAGRLYVDRRPTALHLIDISLIPEHRGAGIGTELIRGLQSEAAASDRGVALHVARGNRAEALYEGLGFRLTADLGVYRLLEWRAR